MADKKDKDLDPSANPEPETIEGDVDDRNTSSEETEGHQDPEVVLNAEDTLDAGTEDKEVEAETGDADAQAAAENPDPQSELGQQDRDDASATVEQSPPPAPLPKETVVVEKRGGFFPALIGGIIAAGLGFLAGKSQVIDPYLPETWRSAQSGEAIAALESRIAEQGDRLTELSEAVAGFAVPDTSALEGEVSNLSASLGGLPDRMQAQGEQLSTLGDSVAQLETRLSELEKRPISEGISEDAIAAYEAEIDKLRESISSQRSEVEAMVEEARQMEVKAAADAQSAANRAAAARLRDQVTAGVPYAGALDELRAAGVEIPTPLPALAQEGIPTMAALREAWDPAAREALATAREADKGTGFRAFLERQTGARSVIPREGDDPDAVLSRAQAHLTRGDLQMTLDQLDALPEPAQEALSDWTAMARTRLETVAAADALVQRLNSN
ncbi:COG4223 family protein [Cribrihabitans sp. XS_ASV171]